MVAAVDAGGRGRHRRAGGGLALTDAALTPARSQPARGGLRGARVAVIAYFALLGIANGVWLARIPAIKQDLHLTDGVLGLALLSGPVGAVAAMLIASRVVHRVGSRRSTMIAGILAALLPVALGLAPSLAALMVALAAFGLAAGMLDASMNSQAVLVERGVGRPLMASFHACYSFGGMAGALLGGLFAAVGIGPAANFAALGVPLACAAILAGRWLVADSGGNTADPAPAERRAAGDQPPVAGLEVVAAAARRLLRSWPPALLLMALLATCSLLCEGAAGGWTAVYLHDNVGVSAGLAAIGYAGFSLAMAVGRLSGDRLNARFGASVLMRCCAVIAAAGLGLGLLTGDAAGALVGFTMFGAGLSCTFPLLLSAAGNVDPARPTHGIARVAGFGYAGDVGGPVIIGGLASALGLRLALLVPVALAAVMAAGAGVTRAGTTVESRGAAGG
jgi:MFS family permease